MQIIIRGKTYCETLPAIHFVSHHYPQINQSINQSQQVQEIVGALAKKMSATGAEFTPALAARALFGLQVITPPPTHTTHTLSVYHHMSPLISPSISWSTGYLHPI